MPQLWHVVSFINLATIVLIGINLTYVIDRFLVKIIKKNPHISLWCGYFVLILNKLLR